MVRQTFRTSWIGPAGPDLEAFEQGICRLPVFVDSEARSSNTDATDLVESVLPLAELDMQAGAAPAGPIERLERAVAAASLRPERFRAAAPRAPWPGRWA